MSSQEQTLLSLLSHVALDGGLAVVLAVTAVRFLVKICSISNALKILRSTPSVSVGDLRSLLDSYDDKSSGASEKLVIVRGTVEAKVASENSWKSGRSNLFVSRESGNGAVIIQRTQTCVYKEWKGFLGWTQTSEQKSMPLKMVPFVLIDHGRSVDINMEGSKHSLPLITVYHQLPCTLSQSLRGHKHLVGLLEEEKILPLGKNITAVGLCSINNGTTEIKSCKDLPYFLSDLTKDQMIVDLSSKTRVLFWGGIFLGSLSAAVLGYAIYRNWNRWKSWRQQNQTQKRDDDCISFALQQRDDDCISFALQQRDDGCISSALQQRDDDCISFTLQQRDDGCISFALQLRDDGSISFTLQRRDNDNFLFALQLRGDDRILYALQRRDNDNILFGRRLKKTQQRDNENAVNNVIDQIAFEDVPDGGGCLGCSINRKSWVFSAMSMDTFAICRGGHIVWKSNSILPPKPIPLVCCHRYATLVNRRQQNQTQQRDNENAVNNEIDQIASEDVPGGGCFGCSINRKLWVTHFPGCRLRTSNSILTTGYPGSRLVCCQRYPTSVE